MPKFRKKPVVIEAIQFTGENAVEINFFTDRQAYPTSNSVCQNPTEKALIIPTLEGNMRADVGDWIIKGVNGEFYHCKPNIFAKTYEPADANNNFTIYLKGNGGLPVPKSQLNSFLSVLETHESGDCLYRFDNGIHINLSQIAAIDELKEDGK